MTKRILWVDDEIDLLRPHVRLLEEKGYNAVLVGENIVSSEFPEKKIKELMGL